MKYRVTFVCFFMLALLAWRPFQTFLPSSNIRNSRLSTVLSFPLVWNPTRPQTFSHISSKQQMASAISATPLPGGTDPTTPAVKPAPSEEVPELSAADFRLYNRLAELMEYYVCTFLCVLRLTLPTFSLIGSTSLPNLTVN